MYQITTQKFDIDPKLVAPIPLTPRLSRELKEFYQQAGANEKRLLFQNAEEFLRAVPKAELHLHSTAMTDLFTIAPLAWEISQRTDRGLQRRKESRGSVNRLIAEFLAPNHGSLAAYLNHYDLLKNYIIRDLDAVRMISYVGAKQAFENGVRILEIRTTIKAGEFGDPRSLRIMDKVGYTDFAELCARIEGFRQAEKETGGQLKVYLIITFRRQDSQASSMQLLKRVLAYQRHIREKYGRSYIVGVDVAGAETGHSAKNFRNVFRYARSRGLKVTAHAGEELGAGEASIWDALNSGAQRIGHGTALYRPTPLLPKKARYEVEGRRKNAFILSLIFGTAYEMCLSSNIACGAEVTKGYRRQASEKLEASSQAMTAYKQHPAPIIFALGNLAYRGRSAVIPIPCTDGIYTLNTNLVREYGIAAKTFDLGMKEVLAIARYSIRHSFAPAEVKGACEKQWENFASFYLKDPKFAGPDREAKRALHLYRQRMREKLGITPSEVEAVASEVDQTALYLHKYLRERFFEEMAALEV